NYYSGIGEEENRDFGYRDYNGEVSLLSHGFQTADNQEWPFSPGEGILSTIPEEGNDPPEGGTNIRYIGLSDDGTVVTAAPYTGDRALVYNGNTNKDGWDETGYVANVAFAGDGAPPPELRETYTVDAVLGGPGSRAPADLSAPPPYRMKPVETLELP
ncbi:MAG: hypothetical protein JXA95_06720, partial [Spirochaetales bacterium]|nr:hypothetical protein [Spirochaetales bacterium]